MAYHYDNNSLAPTSTVQYVPPRLESIDETDTVAPVGPLRDPFASGNASEVHSSAVSISGASENQPRPTRARFFHSRRVKKGEVERPWLNKKEPMEKWVWILPVMGITVGVVIAAYLIYTGLNQVTKHQYCQILNEDWSKGIDGKTWMREVELGGYGNGQFEMTTADDANAFIHDGSLILKPTLQDESLIENNNVINLLDSNTCTSDSWAACVATTNTTNGTIVNPVKSARLSTRNSARIRYGRVEVVAKLPAGDWLWPAIWMLPSNNTYGPWPQSGEIDIMESRGNNYTFPQGGNEVISSTLHWGPDGASDRWFLNNNKRNALHTTFSTGFHTFGLEWSEKYMFTHVDSKLAQVLYIKFDEYMWKRGMFPPAEKNGSILVDPWSQTGLFSTPFDQDFHLILNVAVGGTNGWFDDGTGGKPWVDNSVTAKKDFWDGRHMWLPTWEKQGQLEVKSVKIWQQKGYNGC